MAEENKTPDPDKEQVVTGDNDAENNTGNPPPTGEGKGDGEKEGTKTKDTSGEGTPSDTGNSDGEKEGKKEGEKEGEKEGDTQEEGEKELDTSVWGDTGDEVGNSVLQVMQNSGLSPEDAKALLYDPVQQGDPTKVDRDALVEKVGKANANLIIAGIENYVARSSKAAEETLSTVYDVAGSKEQWEKVAPWVKANIPEAERAEYAAMLDKGGAQARFAAQELVTKYNADPKNTAVGKKTTVEGDGKAPTQGRAITRVQYAEELEKAHRTGASQATIKEIQLARERGRKQGI